MSRCRPAHAATARALGCVMLVTLLTACGGGTADPIGATASAGPTSELDAYLDEIFAYDDETTAVQHAEDEEVIAACMAQTGFEYRPQAPPRQYPWPDPLTAEFAAEFGYGDTTETLGPDVPPAMWSHTPGQDPAVDFNESYVGSMSADAREEYFLAMHGRDLEPGEDLDERPAHEAGCRERAYAAHQVPHDFEELQTAIREGIWWVDEDDRVVATLPVWSSCMADAGYPGLTLVEEARGLTTDRVNASSLSVVAPWHELEAKHGDELAALQELEIEVAVADVACREEAGWYDVRAEVLAEVQAAILERYGVELDAWVAWVREQREARPER